MSARGRGLFRGAEPTAAAVRDRVGASLRVATDADLDAIVDVDGGDQFAVASLACSISFTKRAL
jgi:hypothetical protein